VQNTGTRDLRYEEGSCSFVRGPLVGEWEIEIKALKYTHQDNRTLGDFNAEIGGKTTAKENDD
jgi:hypothetical protein